MAAGTLALAETQEDRRSRHRHVDQLPDRGDALLNRAIIPIRPHGVRGASRILVDRTVTLIVGITHESDDHVGDDPFGLPVFDEPSGAVQ